jgi:hypothetical protein
LIFPFPYSKHVGLKKRPTTMQYVSGLRSK